MSQRDNFSGGFLLGAIVGGIAGGLLGTLFASGRLNDLSSEEPLLSGDQPDAKPNRTKKRALNPPAEQSIEAARRSLEDKIAQLNDAIDDVRQQLGGVNGSTPTIKSERPVVKEP